MLVHSSQCPQRPEEGIRISGTGLTGFVSSRLGAVIELEEEQLVLLITEQTFQPQRSKFSSPVVTGYSNSLQVYPYVVAAQ